MHTVVDQNESSKYIVNLVHFLVDHLQQLVSLCISFKSTSSSTPCFPPTIRRQLYEWSLNRSYPLRSSSFEIHDESTLDETDSSEDEFEANECHEHEESAEAMEESDSHSESQEATTESDGQSGEEFSLVYMKKVLNYYDETDKNGKRTHSWKVVTHRFRRIHHQQDISRFREYVCLGGSVRQKPA
ncbi:unnamed protein product [Rotaria sordida]|uniref:Uncharacterized protein n=1 Tax=Rotaria sordida TaxID=392033 RepID=A0A816DF66_9BILA|nr:unnamed protein product [Rotaria sordida]CAF1633924.1 unnamed protein product [Rotaria sordida]